MKICKKCLKDQELNQFHKHPYSKDRLQSTCKACMKVVSHAQAEARKVLRLRNQEIILQNNNDFS